MKVSDTVKYVLVFTCLAAFALWYGGTWAYRTQYKTPRTELGTEIARFEQFNAQFDTTIKSMQQFVKGNQAYYTRSFPLYSNSARTLYQNWLSEVAKCCDVKNPQIESYQPTRPAAGYGFNYRFQLQGQFSKDGFARFLYEFYWASYLQRLVSVTLMPIEKSELMDVVMIFDGTALFPPPEPYYYPLKDKLPENYHRRLSSGPFSAYSAVADRSLLQYTKSGLDKADYTFLTSIISNNGVAEIWFTDRTTTSPEPDIYRVGDTIRIGSVVGKLVDIEHDYVVFERGAGQLWLLSAGECLNRAFAVPPEAK